ncbi:MAG: hypothetical protein E7277_05255 [Lachnospiraceae bacterium]|nr:hypothetical protein [Lachnospiraceae bacterium]
MSSGLDIILEECNKQQRKVKEIINGICSRQFIMALEQKEAELDVMSFRILLERLGKNPDDLEYILTKKEYDCMLTKRKIMMVQELN